MLIRHMQIRTTEVLEGKLTNDEVLAK